MKTLVTGWLLSLLSVSVAVAQTSSREMAWELFDAAPTVGALGTDAVALAAEAVWGASELAGQETISGTLTQSSTNSEVWTYSSTPNDRLIVAFSAGPAFEFIFAQFEGYTEGTWEDFVSQHALDMTVSSPGHVDLRVVSQSVFVADKTVGVSRHVTGSVRYEGETVSVDLFHNAQTFEEIDSGWLHVKVQDVYSGSATSPSKSFTFDQGSRTDLIHTNLGTVPEHIRESEVFNNSSVDAGGVTYRFEDAYAFSVIGSYISEGLFNVIIEPEKWEARGKLRRDEVEIGVVRFNAPVLPLAVKPELIVRLHTGEDVFVHTIPGATVTSRDHDRGQPENYTLHQNFPNPFGSLTTIAFTLPRPGAIEVTVFDLLGRHVRTLEAGTKPAGTHEVTFERSGLAAGIYLYRLKTADFVATKSMVVL